MSKSLQVKPSKLEKRKSDFTALGKVSMHMMIYGVSRKSLEWLKNELMIEIKRRDRKL